MQDKRPLMKKYFLLALLYLPYVAFGQQAEMDSLLKVLTTAKDDTAKVYLYIAIGNACEYEDPQRAARYYLQAGDLSRRLDYKMGLIKFISNYTGVLNVRGAYDSSLMLNKQAIELARQLGDQMTIAKAYANTGNSYHYLSEYDSAVYCYEMAGRYFQEIDNKYLVARMYEVEQLIYQNMGQYKKALQYGKRAVSELRISGDSVDLGRCLLNLANSYESNNYRDSALPCYREALAVSQRANYIQGQSASLLGIGNIYYHMSQADQMKPYYEKALAITRGSDDMQGQLTALRGLSLYYLLKNELDSAQVYCRASLSIADTLGTKHDLYESLHVLSSILYAQHHIIEAENVRSRMQVLENEMRGDEFQQKTIAIEKRFETEKKEARIKLQEAQLRQKSTLNYILIGGLLALAIIAGLSYRTYRQRQKLQQQRISELETEKQLTATEAILKGEEKERSRLAQDLHDGLGGLLSGIKYSLNNMKENLIMTPANAQAFERSIGMLDHSISEMRRVAHNLMPENLLKFGLDAAMRDFCSEMQMNGMLQVRYQSLGLKDKSIDQSLSVTVYRVTQELLNNIVKHAGATEAMVQIAAGDRQLTITVEDNGKGLAEEQIKKSPGIGWQNIYSRVQYHKGTISIQSIPGQGTSVYIEFPVA